MSYRLGKGWPVTALQRRQDAKRKGSHLFKFWPSHAWALKHRLKLSDSGPRPASTYRAMRRNAS